MKSVEITHMAVHDLTPYENNAKIHTVKQLEGLSQSIKRFGFKQPIVIDRKGVIIAGHGRYEAAAALGMEKVPCIIADDLTDEEIRAYRILDNKLAETGTDLGKLEQELNTLDFDFSEFKVEFPEFEHLENAEANHEEDNIPEPKIEPISKRGDVWILGNHRLMCGDSTMIDDVEKLLKGKQPDFIYTDPPYGINLETDYKKRYGHEKGSSTSQFYGEDTGIDLGLIITHPATINAKELFIWGADNYPDCLNRGGSWIVWDKSVPAVDGIASDFELCWSRERHHYSMFRILWKGVKAREESGNEGDHKNRWGHPTQKPIELALRFFDTWGKKAKSVLDYFGGSGTTLITCEKTNRSSFLMEISPNFCDLIINRWQKFTGQKAVLEATGELFDSLSPLV